MVKICAVANCKNHSEMPGISFHRFPRKDKNAKLRALWWSKCMRLDRSSPYKNSSICGIHFNENDIIYNKYEKYNICRESLKNKRTSWSSRLTENAVPRLHLPSVSNIRTTPDQSSSLKPKIRRKRDGSCVRQRFSKCNSTSAEDVSTSRHSSEPMRKEPNKARKSCEENDGKAAYTVESQPIADSMVEVDTVERLQSDTHCQSLMRNMFLDEALMDVTVFAQGKSIKAHRAVLRQASGYFKEVLSLDLTAECEVILKDVEFDDVVKLIGFIYMGEVSINSSVLGRFLKMAELLEVYSLLPWDLNVSPMEYEEHLKGLGASDVPDRERNDYEATNNTGYCEEEISLNEDTKEVPKPIFSDTRKDERTLSGELPSNSSLTHNRTNNQFELEDMEHNFLQRSNPHKKYVDFAIAEHNSDLEPRKSSRKRKKKLFL